MSGTTGKNIKISVFGQSHGKAVGVVIDGLPAGFKIDMDKVNSFMARRAPGSNKFSTPRKEPDKPEIISGVVDDVTCGAPLCAIIKNANAKGSDYDGLKDVPRPSHADYAAFVKFNGFNDASGGGNFSGRLTAPLCFAGSVCIQILESKGVKIKSHIYSIAGIKDRPFDLARIDETDLTKKEFPVLDDDAGEKMKDAILKAKSDLDSVGGIVECALTGVPAGLGDPNFDGVENNLAKNIFAIPAVKGIEFGAGFAAADLKGSENNDPYRVIDGKVATETNNNGGITGGITNGMPIVFRAALKPTPSIGKEQRSVNLSKMENASLTIRGRHDPCVAVRAVPAIEAVAAFTILDFFY